MKSITTGVALTAVFASQAFAQIDLGRVDPGRVVKEQLPEVAPREKGPAVISGGPGVVEAPASAAETQTEFTTIEITGVTAFPDGYFDEYISGFTNKTVPLTVLWDITNHINQAYAEKGYLLSRAYVPDQVLDSGIAQIRMVEGYIEDVTIDGAPGQLRMLTRLMDNVKLETPLRAKTLEAVLLRLNDLYGVSFDAVLGKSQTGNEGATVLNLITEKTRKNFLFASADTFGSRFAGPGRFNIYFERSFAKFQSTAINGLITLPETDELNVIGLTHKIQVTPSVEVSGSVSRTISEPGHTLEVQDIDSASTAGNLSLNWKAIRTRDQNLTLSLGANALDSRTDVSDIGLTRDQVRSAQLSASYEATTPNNTRHVIEASLTQGIDGLGSSEAGDLNVSRGGAVPDFTKANLRYQHNRLLSENVAVRLDLRGQYTSDSLYSSEEFGYGGADIGRAFDYSELLGDSGVSAGVEISAQKAVFENDALSVHPYAFADTGRVWNNVPAGGTESESASSAGLGLRVNFDDGPVLDAFVAVPIGQSIETPIFGEDEVTFRVSFQRKLSF